MKHTKIAAALVMTTAFAGSALADDSRQLSQRYDYQGETLVFDVGVGEAELLASDDNEIRIEVQIEAASGNWLSFWKHVDLEDRELTVKQKGNRLLLSVNDQDDIKQHWRVYLPKQAPVSLEVGVGQVEITGLVADLDVEVGVGQVSIEHGHAYRRIELHSGVGEVNYSRQGRQQQVERNLVSQNFETLLDGEGDLKVNVGVGEVDVREL
ncbi:hypothetical protein [Shewanella sedimentimangrovi]|uniref:Adhesin domain-containing protein n=1 Tax=Shewanella sedimentimangrovi TaxID=2814293 RepID=A0ABX7R064_9GAMM|nr:hypothetical protein [Shewanella sedimentimangrovi]QSX36260.1 hypothetical protein JYB85_13145 [Shewanella sedimentimangrovi]